jgi:hypothetical protein
VHRVADENGIRHLKSNPPGLGLRKLEVDADQRKNRVQNVQDEKIEDYRRDMGVVDIPVPEEVWSEASGHEQPDPGLLPVRQIHRPDPVGKDFPDPAETPDMLRGNRPQQ